MPGEILENKEILYLERYVGFFVSLRAFFCFHLVLSTSTHALTNCLQVEDKRLELEKKYVSLRARHEGMMKVHNMTKQHLQRLKVL